MTGVSPRHAMSPAGQRAVILHVYICVHGSQPGERSIASVLRDLLGLEAVCRHASVKRLGATPPWSLPGWQWCYMCATCAQRLGVLQVPLLWDRVCVVLRPRTRAGDSAGFVDVGRF